MLTRVRAVGATVALAVAAAGTVAGPAGAQAVGCGSVLTSDTTLSADIVDCSGDGLVIGASGITVDLDGHTVAATRNQGGAPDGVGIDDSAGFDDVTVRNGTVEGFGQAAVRLTNADGARVEQLDTAGSLEAGVVVEGGSGNAVRGNDLRFPGQFGIVVRGDADQTAIDRNRIENPGTAGIVLEAGCVTGTTINANTVTGALNDERDGGGIIVGRREAPVSGTRVTGNDVSRNYDRGIFVGAASSGTAVAGNTLTDNTFAGIENAGDNTTIRANRLHDDLGLTGVAVWNTQDASRAVVEGNSTRGASDAGVDDAGTDSVVRLNAIDGRLGDFTLGFWAGIVVRPESIGARIEGNAVTHQSQDGIAVSGRSTAVSANLVAETTYGDGLRVAAAARDVRLTGTVGTRAVGGGIAVPTTTLTRNFAARNGALGILAIAGVTDGGGNRASGNGDPAQCSGVTCTP
jgi:parallel beta-helix repeat protein